MRMENNISSTVKKYILYSAAALTMIAATVFILYQQVSKNIINTNIATMNEVALHDSMAVESVINERWSLLEALGDDLRHERFTTTKEVLAELREKLERYIEINKGFRTVYLQFDFSRKY